MFSLLVNLSSEDNKHDPTHTRMSANANDYDSSQWMTASLRVQVLVYEIELKTTGNQNEYILRSTNSRYQEQYWIIMP